MTQISNQNVSQMGASLQTPLLKYNFTISFYDVDGNKLPYSDLITRQVTKISKLRQVSCANFGLQLTTDFKMEFEEDILNQAMLGVQELFNLENFTIKIEMTDGANVVKTTTIKDVSITEIHHGEMDYSSATVNYHSYIKIDGTFGADAIVKLRADPTVDDIFTLLEQSQFEIFKETGVPALKSTVVFKYSRPLTIE
jgi:hypothetical protein